MATNPFGGVPGGDSFGGTGGPTPGFNDPGLTGPQGDIYSMLQRLIGSGPNLLNFIQQGMNSPLLQSILQPALGVQERQFAGQRQDVTDAMRAAGGLRSSQYGVNLNRLQGDQALAQGNLMAQIIAQTLNPLLTGQMEAYKAPIAAYNALFSNLPNQTFWPGFNPGGGGGAGGGGYGTADRSMGGGTPTGPSFGAINPNFQPGPSGGSGGGPGSWWEPGGVMGDIGLMGSPGGPGGGPIQYNPLTGSYESYTPTPPSYLNDYTGQRFTDYGQYAGSLGLGYDPSIDQGLGAGQSAQPVDPYAGWF